MTTKKRISNRSKRTQESTDHKEVQLSTSVEFTGPLPPPAVLDGYEKILPGSASRILELVEKEQKHRHDTDQALIERTFTERRIGQGLGFVIGVVTVLTGGYVAVHGAEFAGSLIGIGGITGLVSVFILGRK